MRYSEGYSGNEQKKSPFPVTSVGGEESSRLKNFIPTRSCEKTLNFFKILTVQNFLPSQVESGSSVRFSVLKGPL